MGNDKYKKAERGEAAGENLLVVVKNIVKDSGNKNKGAYHDNKGAFPFPVNAHHQRNKEVGTYCKSKYLVIN